MLFSVNHRTHGKCKKHVQKLGKNKKKNILSVTENYSNPLFFLPWSQRLSLQRPRPISCCLQSNHQICQSIQSSYNYVGFFGIFGCYFHQPALWGNMFQVPANHQLGKHLNLSKNYVFCWRNFHSKHTKWEKNEN